MTRQEYQKNYRQIHAAALKAYAIEYRANHRKQANLYAKAYRQKNRTRIATQQKLYTQTHREQIMQHNTQLEVYLKRMVERARMRSKLYGVEFDVDFDFVRQLYDQQKGKCAYTGYKFLIKHGLGKGSTNRFTPSLERVDNSRGYTSDNVVLVCVHANKAKLHHSLTDLLDMSRRMARRLPKLIAEREVA